MDNTTTQTEAQRIRQLLLSMVRQYRERLLQCKR